MVEAFLRWVREKMSAGEYFGWFAIAEDGAIAAGAGLWLMDWPPHMIGPGSRRGNILNVYTDPEYRRQGLARRLTETAIGRAWCTQRSTESLPGFRRRNASCTPAIREGRELRYRSLGFERFLRNQ
jgi:GNAT superfamily N-acetyltransferase